MSSVDPTDSHLTLRLYGVKDSDHHYICAALASSTRLCPRPMPACVCVELGGVLFDGVAGINRMLDDKKLHRHTVVPLSASSNGLCLFMATGD